MKITLLLEYENRSCSFLEFAEYKTECTFTVVILISYVLLKTDLKHICIFQSSLRLNMIHFYYQSINRLDFVTSMQSGGAFLIMS